MKYIFFLLIFLANEILLVAQPFEIPDTKLTIEMPNKKWKLVDTLVNKTMKIYTYKRDFIEDKLGQHIIPNISIIVEKNDGMDVVTYSANKRSEMPGLEIKEVYVPKDIKMEYKNGIGYKAGYTDEYGKYLVQILFINDGAIGLRIICDVTEELFDQVEDEFLDTFRSIKKL